ncbi:BTB domain-containing protein [Mycena indigotica]|uniref:BTB domain-containing protein n=1 Tax=Mycena indigotica TaxID=2126181 RepID=A0A8H6W4V1_9AGAR|nr:BTB domain-containing protein [Mycena indigotica]KAF7299304.1 BTB domain-containing protein [Mycena indigotica]
MDVAACSPQKAEGLWWDDCGMVLQAGNTVYRLSRNFLAMHSPVFRDMLLLPLPEDAETFEGCSLVRLTDTAEDATNFFNALARYDFFPPHPLPTTFPILASVLRMSDKYGVDGLRARALAHLSAVHPTTLGDFRALPSGKGENPLIDGLYQASAEMVVLARQLSLDWLLPIAFYRLCELNPHPHIFTSELALADKERWLTGLRLLEGTENSKMINFLWTPRTIDGCTSKIKCSEERLACRKEAETWGIIGSKTAMRQLPLDLWDHGDWARLAVCNNCLATMMAEHSVALSSFWDRLPAIFDLPSWSALEQRKLSCCPTV